MYIRQKSTMEYSHRKTIRLKKNNPKPKIIQTTINERD